MLLEEKKKPIKGKLNWSKIQTKILKIILFYLLILPGTPIECAPGSINYKINSPKSNNSHSRCVLHFQCSRRSPVCLCICWCILRDNLQGCSWDSISLRISSLGHQLEAPPSMQLQKYYKIINKIFFSKKKNLKFIKCTTNSWFQDR